MSKYPGNIITTGADTGYSVYFDGTGDYLSIPYNIAFAPGSGDFTVEAYVMFTAFSTTSGVDQIVVGNINGSTGAGDWGLFYRASPQRFEFAGSSTGVVGGIQRAYYAPASFIPGKWYSLIGVKSGSTLSIYVDGVKGTDATLATVFNGSTALNIGCGAGVTTLLTGNISNLRIVKGTALYSGATINVPTQLLNITNTSLLTCNSPAIVDQSSNAFAITANGNAAVSTFTPFAGYTAYNPALGAATPGIWTVSDALQAASTRQWNMYDPYFNYTTLKLSGTPVTNVPTWITDASANNYAITVNGDARAAGLSPFSLTTYPNSGSGYFDGTSDYLVTTTNLPAISGEATFECWVYPTTSGVATIYATGTATQFTVYRTSGNGLGVQSGTTAYIESAGSLLPTNTWTHIAVTKNATNTFVMYVNGAVASAATSSGTMSSTYAAGVGYIGCAFNISAFFTGYISNLRFVNGLRVYTGAFTAPTAPLTATQPAGTNIAAITGTSTSLLTLQNSQSSNNNSFLDSSSNNFLITRNGNATQGTFTPFTQTGWSNYFNGSSSYLSSTIAAPGTGNFTYEFWVYAVDHVAPAGEWGMFQTSTTSGGLVTNYTSGVQLARSGGVFWLNVAGTVYASTVTIQLGTFYHIAVVRNSGTISLYVNGVNSITSATNTTNLTSTNVAIGCYYSASYAMKGYISNFRATNAAVYTSNFTPPTAPLTSSNASTTLLTCQSNRFIDTNTQAAAKTVTANGTPSIQAFSPFNTNVAYTPATIGGSAYFDGASDYLTAADNAALDVSSGDFTVECWFYATGVTAEQPIVTRNNGSISLGTSLQYNIFILSGSARVRPYSGTTDYTINVGTVVSNAWNHIALVRTGNTFYGYLNGTRSATTQTIVGSLNTGTWSTYIGGALISGGSNLFFNGYCGGVRVTKGGALYTGSTYTIPTSPFTTTVSAGSANLLLNFTNAGIVDTTAKNALETVGTAAISTSRSKYGGSSIYFPTATGNRLVIPANQYFDFYTGDFTVDFWFYWFGTNGSNGAPAHIIGDADPYFGSGSWSINIEGATLGTTIQINGNGNSQAVYTTALSTNTWYHLALSRTGTNMYCFLNGTSLGANTITGSQVLRNNFADVVNPVYVGSHPSYPGLYFDGYIQDVRISRYARYVTNFTPPTSLLQNQ